MPVLSPSMLTMRRSCRSCCHVDTSFVRSPGALVRCRPSLTADLNDEAGAGSLCAHVVNLHVHNHAALLEVWASMWGLWGAHKRGVVQPET